MPVDNTKTGLSNYTDLKQNDPIQSNNPLFSNSYNYFIENSQKPATLNYSELKSVIKPTAKNNILISDDPVLNDINRQANYLNDIKQLPLSEVAVKYSKNILPYKEEFNDFYNNNTWFKSGVDEMLNTGNIAGVENLFNSTMAANQTSWQKVQKGFRTMGTELMAQSFGGMTDLAAMVSGAIGLTVGQIINPFYEKDRYADWSNSDLLDFNPDYTSKIRTAFNRGGIESFFNTEYWNGDTSLGIAEKDNNKIWLTNAEMNNPWKMSVGNISQNIIGGMGPTLGFLIAGGITSGISKGLMSIGTKEVGLSSGLSLATKTRRGIKSFLFKSGEAIKNNTGVILGTLEGHVEGYEAAKQFIKQSKDQIDTNYNNVISNYFYDILLQKYDGNKAKVLDVLQYLGKHNFDNASLLSSGINPDSVEEVKRQAEYLKNTSLKEMDKQALQAYAITFGINSVINGIANKYMIQPLFDGASSKLKSGVHFKFRNKDIKLGGSKIIDGPNGIPLINTKKNIFQKIWKNPLTRTFIGLGSEGGEEFAQELTNAFAEGRSNAAMNNLYADLYNKENEEYFKKQSSILSAGFSELWDAATDPKRALFAGTLGVLNAGLMVTPSFGNKVVRQPETKAGKISKKIGQVIQLNWSPRQLYKQTAAENKRKDEFKERWNTWANNPENSQTLSLLNASLAQEEFLKGRDLDVNTSLFDIKNKKLQQFFTSISLARQAGIEKEYISALKNAHSQLNKAVDNIKSPEASVFIEQAVNNGLLSKENIEKPEEVKKSLDIILNNTKNMLDMVPKISKLDSQISSMYGDMLDPKTKSLLIYGHLQRENWISRKKELENITGNSSISNIATSIDSKMNNVSGNFDWELFSLGNSGIEAKNNVSKIQSDLENTINKFTKAKKSQYDKLKTLKRGTKEYQDTVNNYTKASAAEKHFKKNLSKFKKTYNHVINTTKSWDDNMMNTPFSFTLNDFMNLSNTQKAKVLEKYEKNNLPKQQMEIIKNFIDEISVDFEKNNKTSYIDAVKDLAKVDEGLNDLNNNLLRYQTKPEEIQKDSIKAEVKQVVNNINDKVSSKINELSSMEANDLLIEFNKIKDNAEISDFKPSNQKNEDDIFNITLFSELKKLKASNNSEIGNKLNTIKEIKKDGDVITVISNDEETNDFEKQFLTAAYTFLIEKNIDPATMSVVREKLYDNNAAMLHEMFDEFFSYFSEIGSSFQEIVDENPEIEDKHVVDNTIPQKYISNVPTPFTLNGNYMKLLEFENLLSKLPDYVKEANSNKIKEDTTSKVEDSSEELLNTINSETENTPIDEVIVEDVIDPKESSIGNTHNSTIEQKKADIKRNLGITLTDEEIEVLDYLSGQKNQMKDFYDNKGLLTTLGRKLNSIVEQTGKKLAEAISKKLGFKVEDVRVQNNLGSFDVIKQYQTKDGKPIGDYEQLVYNYLNAKYDAELAALGQIKETNTTNIDIDAKKLDIEKRRQDAIDNLFSSTQASVDKKLNTPVQKLSKEEINKNIEASYKQNKDLIKKLEEEFKKNTENNVSDEVWDEWDDKATKLDSNLYPGVTFRVTNGKIELIDNQSYRDINFGGNRIIQVSVATLHNQTEEFQVGDRLQIHDGSRAFPALVTKINKNGKVLEAKADDGSIVISKGNIITTAPIDERIKIKNKYESELAALEKNSKQTLSKNIEVNPDKINISSNDVFAFDIDEKSEFYWSSGVFKNDSVLVDYFRKHNTLSFLQSGRLKYFITGKRPTKDSIKDSRNASKLFFMVDRSLEKDIYDKMISEGKTYDARQHTPIVIITEDKNGTILIKGKKYQVVTAISGGASKNHPYFNTFYDKYILNNKELTAANQPEDGIVLLTDELNNPIFTNAVTSIPVGKNIASSNTNTKGHKTYVNNTSNSNENGPYDKFPLIEINAELEHGIPGAEKTTGVYRIFDDNGNKIDDDWTIVEKKSTIVDTQDNLRKMSFAFLQHKNSTSDTENVYLYSHSLESIDKDDFLNTLKGFLTSLNDSNINNETKEELHKQLRKLLTDVNSRSKYSGAKTISLTRDQVLLFLQGVLKVKTNNTTTDNSIIISQGDNFDNINILKKYILISTEYLKIDKGAIYINKPNPSENTGRIKIANWVKIFDPIENKTEDIETIQKLANVITAELLTIPDVKFNIDYADLKEVPGETPNKKYKREQNFRRLLSDGLIYTSGSTVKRPSRVVRDVSTGDYTHMYDIPMIPPIDVQKAVNYDHSTKVEKTVQSNDVVNEHNIKEKTTTVDNSNNEIDPISEVVITENDSKDNTKSIFNRIFNTINKLIDNTQKIKLNEDGSKYVDENGVEYYRVTTVTKDDTVNILNPIKSADSLNYGTLIDEFIRDFFNFKLKDLSEYTFSNEIVLTEFVIELTKLKEYFLKNGETVISKELRLADPNLKLAGTTDIVTIDNEGKVRIYDIKTMNGNNFTQADATQGVSKFESTTFGKSKKQKYQEQLSLYRILLNNTEGILADELFIIPINIQYEEMMDNIDSIEVLPLYKMEALNEVGPYNMSDEVFVKPTVKEETKTITPSIKPDDPIRDISLDFNPMEDQFMKVNDTLDNDDKLMSNHKEEFEYLQKILPQFFSEDGTPLPEIITIVEGLINISENIENIDDPDNKAYGKYAEAHITLSNTAKRGTAYHEAMHYILDTFFTKTEREIFLRQVKNNPIFEQAIQSVDGAEEALAEIFRVGLNDKIDTKETIFSSFFENKFIKKVFFRIRTFFGLQPKTIQELFYRVTKGFYANKSIISEKTDININTSINNDLVKLDNKIQNPEINVKKLLENGQITFTNEDGDPCAAEGIKTHSSKGSVWKIIKEFSGKTHEEGGIKTKINSDNENITIEVEDSELKIQNDNGDIAIIPSKYAIEVKDMIAGQCWNCVNAFVEKLPELQ